MDNCLYFQISDKDECRINNGGCNQTCINTRGSYHCLCKSGFKLDSDGKSCNCKFKH